MDIMITIPYDIKELTGKDIAIYATLYQMGYGFILSANLYVSTWDLVQQTKLKITDIKESMEKLMGFSEVRIQELDKNKYSVDLGTMFSRMESFVMLPAIDVSRILNSGLRNRFDLLYLFTCIVKRVDHRAEINKHKYFVTMLPATYFSKVMNVSVHTIQANVKILENMGIIYVFRVGNMRHSNLMGMVRNRELIDEYAEMCGFSQKEKYS